MRNILNILILSVLILLVLTGCEVLINPSGEISVRQNDTEILTGDEFNFIQILVGESSSIITFMIESNGNTKLMLVGDPELINISGDTSDFVIDQSNVVTPLKPGEFTEFTITFVPTSEGLKNATITIANSDLDENPFFIEITGEGVTPEINVKQGTPNFQSGSGVYDFGEIKVGETSPEITFTIENIGTGALELTNTPNLITIHRSDASMFIVNQTLTKLTLQPGESTDFTITFLPSSIWDKFATVEIANTDLDENQYTFEVRGEGITAPEINVKQGTTNIPSGSGSYDFGLLHASNPEKRVVFTIENLGDGLLKLTDVSNLIKILGSDDQNFQLIQLQLHQI